MVRKEKRRIEEKYAYDLIPFGISGTRQFSTYNFENETSQQVCVQKAEILVKNKTFINGGNKHKKEDFEKLLEHVDPLTKQIAMSSKILVELGNSIK